ncbi:hypothetical protein ACS0TY_010102 [Phlomoides rotata]
MEVEMKLDRWGYEVSTCSDACIFAINSYYDQVLNYGRKRSVILEAPKSDPQCVLGNIFAAHFLCSADPSRAPAFIDAAKSRLEHASLYEKAVFEALMYFISPDRDDDLAVEMHSKLLHNFPRDLVSLKRAQVLCFYMGRPDLSLELVEQLCHVYQYECRFKEAVEFMNNCAQSWGSLSSFMYTHNWWHVALCYLEAQAPMERIRDIYDKCIWKELERSDAMVAEVCLNAAGLLLRIYIRGAHDIYKDRLNNLANCVTDQALWFLEWHLDIFILWVLSCIGEFNKAEDLLKGLKSRVSKMSKKKQQIMQKGLSLAEALYRYGKGEYKEALELFGHDFDSIDYKIIGASDEQLDVFTEVHISLLLETGEASKAMQAIEKQLKKREGAPFLWSLLEKASSMLGREEAASYGEKARELEAAYFT